MSITGVIVLTVFITGSVMGFLWFQYTRFTGELVAMLVRQYFLKQGMNMVAVERELESMLGREAVRELIQFYGPWPSVWKRRVREALTLQEQFLAQRSVDPNTTGNGTFNDR